MITRLLLIIGLLLLAGVGMLSAGRVQGFSTQVVLSESMRPTIRRGSLVISHRLAPGAYHLGDCITFRPPTAEQALVTHRLSQVYISQGILLARTKGDANTNGDPWVIPMGAVVGKCILVIPLAGYAAYLAGTSVGFVFLATVSFLAAVRPEVMSLLRYRKPA